VPDRLRRGALAIAVAVGAVASVAFLMAVARHIRYGSSDNANALLAGHDMLHGNLLLAGWRLPHNSYWLLDLPLFGVASALFGLRDVLLAAVPAAVATAGIAAGTVVAMTGRPDRRRWWVAAAVLLLVLGLPHPYLVFFVLQGPHHMATAVVCLIAFGLLARAGIGGGRWLAGTALLAVAAHSDPFAIGVGIAPVAAAGVVDGLRTRRLGAVAGPLAAAAGGLAGAFLLGVLLELAGGYTPLPDPPTVARWRENLGGTWRVLGALFGLSFPGRLEGGAFVAHAVGAALFAVGIAASAIRSLAGVIRPPTGNAAGAGSGRLRERTPSPAWLDDALLFGCGASAALFALLTDPPHQALNARYLLPVLAFGAVLTGRRAIETTARLPLAAVAAGSLALVAAHLTTPLEIVRGPAVENPTVTVADWLVARNLREGYGQYWVAGLTTVSSRGAVAVRPVMGVEGRLHANRQFASRRWFEGDRSFRFVVVDREKPDGVDEQAAVATFGPPVETADVGSYQVLVWDRNLSVAPDPRVAGH
jgi:hypothetical protein